MNLLSEMGSDRRKMTGAIFTTYPFDPGFTENAVVSMLSKKGVGGNNVVLVDSSKYDQTFDRESGNTVSSAGVNYHLAPVTLSGRRVFHPKVYFFAGERRVYAFVGSANLTQKGFTDNAELFSYFIHEKKDDDPDPSQVAVLKDIRSFLVDFMDSEFADSVGGFAKDLAREEVLPSCSWLDDEDVEGEDGPGQLKFLHNLDRSIFEQVVEFIGDERVVEVHLAAPFFGETVQILRRFEEFDNPDVQLYLQQDGARIPVDELDDWMSEYGNASLSVFDNERFVHGKLLLIKTDESAYCLTGSPNPSMQGMLLSAAEGGNVETAVLRIGPEVDHFDYLFEQDVFTDEVGSSVEEFNPTPEPLPEVEPSETESVPVRLHDVVFNRETAFTGGRLSVEASVADEVTLDDGFTVVESLSEGSFELPISDAEVTRDDEQNLVGLSYDVTSESRQSILNSTCKVRVRFDEFTSNQRWISHKSPEEDDIVREGIESGGTANVPELFPGFLIGGVEHAGKIIALIGDVADGLHDYSSDGDADRGGYTRRTLPPDWRRSSSGSSRDPEEVLSDLFDAYYQQMLSITLDQADEENPTSITQDFVDILSVLNQISANIFLAHSHRDDFGVENTGELLSIPRHHLTRLYRGDSAVIPRFCRRVVERDDREPGEIGEAFGAFHSYVLPQALFSAMVVEREDSDYRSLYENGFEKTANQCLPSQEPTPETVYPQAIDEVTENILEMADSAYSSYQDSSNIAGYIRREYREGRRVKEYVIDFHSRMLLAAGPQAVSNYFRRLEKLIREDTDELDLVRSHGYRFAARFSNNLEMLEAEERSKVVHRLCELNEDWQDFNDKNRSLLEYALPVEG